MWIVLLMKLADYSYLHILIFTQMQKPNQISVLSEKEKEVLVKLPETISRTVKNQLELLIEPFSSPNSLNAKIKRVFFRPNE